MKKRLYTGFSFFSLFASIVIRLSLVIAIVLVYPHYYENPTVILFVLIFCGLLILIIGNDEIIVYGDRVTETDLSIWSMLFKNRPKAIFFADVKRVYLEEKPAASISESVVAIAVSAMLKTRRPNKYRFNIIYFELTDGSVKELKTDLDTATIEGIAAAVNSALQKNNKS
jgi:hypothetical protein